MSDPDSNQVPVAVPVATPPAQAPPIPVPGFVSTLPPEQQAELRAFIATVVQRMSKESPMSLLAKFAESEVASAKVEAQEFERRAYAHFEGVEKAISYILNELDTIKKNQVVLAAKAASPP